MWNKISFIKYYVWKGSLAKCSKALHEATAGSWSQIRSNWKWETLKAVKHRDKLLKQGLHSPTSLRYLPVRRPCLSGVSRIFPELLREDGINSMKYLRGQIQNQNGAFWLINISALDQTWGWLTKPACRGWTHWGCMEDVQSRWAAQGVGPTMFPLLFCPSVSEC